MKLRNSHEGREGAAVERTHDPEMARAVGAGLHRCQFDGFTGSRLGSSESGLTQLGQRQGLVRSAFRGPAAEVCRGEDCCGLTATEGRRSRHSATEQAGNDPWGRRHGARGGGDAQERDGRVRDDLRCEAVGIDLAMPHEPAESAPKGGDGAVVGAAIGGLEKGPDLGRARSGGADLPTEIEQELSRVADPAAGWQVAEEFMGCSNTQTICGRAFLYRGSRRTVTLDSGHAGRCCPRERQLVAADPEVGAGSEQGGGDRGLRGAKASGLPDGGEADLRG